MKSSNPHSGFYEADTSRTLDPNGGNPACNQGGIAIVEVAKPHGFPLGFRPENVRLYEETATTLCNGTRAGFCNGVVVGVDVYNQALTGDKAKTLNSAATDSDHIPCVIKEQPIAIDRAFFNQGQNVLYEPQTYEDGTNPTIVAKGPSAVAYWDGTQTAGTLTARNAGGAQRMPDKENFNCVVQAEPHYIVRRLTPTECARLQGFADRWGHIEPKSEFTDEEYKFWLEVRNAHAAINGKKVKDYSKKQMLTWYNKLWTDSAEYKMYGNGVALPCVLYVMQGIAEAYGVDYDEQR